jgi:hypothetical protein
VCSTWDWMWLTSMRRYSVFAPDAIRPWWRVARRTRAWRSLWVRDWCCLPGAPRRAYALGHRLRRRAVSVSRRVATHTRGLQYPWPRGGGAGCLGDGGPRSPAWAPQGLTPQQGYGIAQRYTVVGQVPRVTATIHMEPSQRARVDRPVRPVRTKGRFLDHRSVRLNTCTETAIDRDNSEIGPFFESDSYVSTIAILTRIVIRQQQKEVFRP